MIMLSCLHWNINFMNIKFNSKGGHVHGLTFSMGILNPSLEYFGYFLSHSSMSFNQCKETLLVRETLHQCQSVNCLAKETLSFVEDIK